MTNQQPKALQFADQLDAEFAQHRIRICNGREAAAELRRLHDEVEALKAQRKPLTEDQLYDVLRQCPHEIYQAMRIRWMQTKYFARAVEAAHGITGETK